MDQTELTFGGMLTRARLRIIAEVLAKEGVAADWSEETISSRGQMLALLSCFIRRATPARLVQEPGRQLFAVTEALRTAGLTYVLETGPAGEDGPVSREVYTPDQTSVPLNVALIDNEPALSLSDLRNALRAGENLAGIIARLEAFEVSLPPLRLA